MLPPDLPPALGAAAGNASPLADFHYVSRAKGASSESALHIALHLACVSGPCGHCTSSPSLEAAPVVGRMRHRLQERLGAVVGARLRSTGADERDIGRDVGPAALFGRGRLNCRTDRGDPWLWCRARTRTSGFRARKLTVGGRHVLRNRRARGRKVLAPANYTTGSPGKPK